MVGAGNAAGKSRRTVQEWKPAGYGWNAVQAVRLNAVAEPKAMSMPPADVVAAPPAAYKQTCLVCHGEEAIAQQRLNATQWEREIEKMQRWGAAVTPDNKSVLIDYLSKGFPVRPRRERPTRHH